jgi:hypothetical protein
VYRAGEVINSRGGGKGGGERGLEIRTLPPPLPSLPKKNLSPTTTTIGQVVKIGKLYQSYLDPHVPCALESKPLQRHIAAFIFSFDAAVRATLWSRRIYT